MAESLSHFEVSLKQKIGSYSVLILIAGLIVALDQWTKWLVRTNLPFTGSWLPEGWDWLMPYARIVHWYNKGAAFGMFQEGSYVFMALAFIVIGVILYFYAQVDPKDWFLRLAMSMQVAGAAGNLIDRLMLEGKVTDFISVGSFPVFNVADASITVGTAILVLGVWWLERKAGAQPAPSDVDESPANSGTGDSPVS